MSNFSIEKFIKTITELFITATEPQDAKKGKVSVEALLEKFNSEEVEDQLKKLIKQGKPKQAGEKKHIDKNQCVKFITDTKLNKLIFNSSDDECSDDECSDDENAPKRGKSGYMFFREKKSLEIKQTHPVSAEKKKRSKKPEGAPTRGKSAYLFFCQANRPEVKEANPSFKATEIMAELGRMWKELPDDEKVEFEEQAAEAKEKYLQEKTEWEEKTEIKTIQISTYKNSSYHSYDDLPAISKGQLSEWYKDGKLDRQGDKPAIIDGSINEWWVDGKCHREGDKPAYVDENHKEWYKDGKIHRDNDLPALINDYCEVWYNNGKRHRGEGLPALILKNGYKEWWVNDICILTSER